MLFKKFLQNYFSKKTQPAPAKPPLTMPKLDENNLNPLAKDVNAVYSILVDVMG